MNPAKFSDLFLSSTGWLCVDEIELTKHWRLVAVVLFGSEHSGTRRISLMECCIVRQHNPSISRIDFCSGEK